MKARATEFSCCRLILMLMASALASQFTALGQTSSANSSVSPIQIAQTIERVRSSVADERTLANALDIGGVLLRSARFGEAYELFTALSEKKPQDPSVLYGLALAAFNVGRVAEAEPIARRAVAAAIAVTNTAGAKSNNRVQSAADALVLLAVVLAVRGDDAGALKSLKQAVSLAPDNFDAQLALGRTLFGMGDYTGAARAFRVANRLSPTNGQALFYLATATEHSGDTGGALAIYRELVARQPGMAEGHLGLGVLLLKRGGSDIEEGIRELQRALDINPKIYEARVTLGRVLIAQGRVAEAVSHLQSAAELAPDNPEPHYQLSLAYRRLGKADQAAAESETVKRIHETRRSGKSVSPEQPR